MIFMYIVVVFYHQLKYQQQINLFNFITNHIKECKFQQKCRARDKNTVYIRLEPALNEIKRLHRENQNLRKRKLDDDSDDDTPSSKKRKI